MATASTVLAPEEPTDLHGVRHRWGVALAASGIVVALVRWLVVRDRREYAIWPDEPAQLAIARFVGGGTRWNMDDHSIWRPLYGVVISPIHWFTDDPVTVLRSALAVNALLGGVAAVLLGMLLRHLTRSRPWTVASVATLASLAPSVLFTAEFVWSESLTLVVYLAALLALLRYHARPTSLRALLAAVAAGCAFATHSRLVPLAVAVVAIAAVAVARGRGDRRQLAVAIAATAAALAAAVIATDLVVDALWDQPSDRNSPGSVLERLADPGSVVVAAIGQVWQLLVASAGFVGLGAWASWRAWRRGCDGSAIVLAVAAIGVGLSSAFMADRLRVDQIVYGRYNAVAALPVIAVGMVAWIDRPRPTGRVVGGVVASTGVLGVALWVLRGEQLGGSNGLEPMILGLQPYLTGDSIPVLGVTAIALVVTAALGALAVFRPARMWPAIGVAALVGLLVVGGVRTGRTIDEHWDDSGDASWYATLSDGPLADESGVDWFLPAGSTSTKQLMLAQFYLPAVEFTVVAEAVTPSERALVFASPDDEALLASTARLVAVSDGRSIGLWER